MRSCGREKSVGYTFKQYRKFLEYMLLFNYVLLFNTEYIYFKKSLNHYEKSLTVLYLRLEHG